MKRERCIVCSGEQLSHILRIENAPISCNHLFLEREAALSEPLSAIDLVFCVECGHVFNQAFDPTRLCYRSGYESSLRGSERFREYDEELVAALTERYGLREQVIVEIGCGRGEFLQALCERGNNSGIGFDPSYPGDETGIGRTGAIIIHTEPYGASHKELDADLICSRHTLEHVGDPLSLLLNVRSAARRLGVPIFVEIPNGLYTLRDNGIWDIIYEHCSYFTPSSLARLFAESGYEIIEVSETYGDQFLTIHAKTGPIEKVCAPKASPWLPDLIDSFSSRYERKLEKWLDRLRGAERAGERIAIWGAGAKASTFLNLLRPAAIEFVVDVNPRKHGKYIAGTGHEIVSPDFLRDHQPDEVICMNAYYREEIAQRLASLGLHARLVAA